MRSTLIALISFSLILGITKETAAQSPNPAVGQWKALYSYYKATSVAAGSNEVFCGTAAGFFTYHLDDEIITAYSKVNGMNDVGVKHVSHDPYTGITLIAYDNSNMDIFENGMFTNLPDIMISSIVGDKTINDVITYKGTGYIATPIGLVIANLKAANIASTIQFYDGSVRAKINSAAIQGDSIYVATEVGIFKTHLLSSSIHDYTTWNKISTEEFLLLRGNESQLYGMKVDNSIHIISIAGVSSPFYTSSKNIRTFYVNNTEGIWVGEDYDGTDGRVCFVKLDGSIIESTRAFFPSGITITPDGKTFFSESDETKIFGGLRFVDGSGNSKSYTPEGPESNSSTDIWAYNGEIWMAHGGRDYLWQPFYNRKMFTSRINNYWQNYSAAVNDLGIDFLTDAIYIYKDRRNQHVYATMAAGGLLELKPEGTLTNYKAGYYELAGGDPNIYVGSGIAQDNKGNLWLSNHMSAHELKMRTPDNQWHKFHIAANISRGASDIIIDDYNNKWFIIPNSGGVAIFNEQETYTNTLDDQYRILRQSKGQGNLPSNNVLSIAKDKDGAIWVGTSSGIGIFSLPNEALTNGRDAELRVLQYEGIQIGNYLFHGISVNAIAVDGNNQKWIGTLGSGLWLISDDGTEAIANFNTQNSPLPSDNIVSIDIDPALGDVYVSTDKGVMIYRGHATDPQIEVADELFIYPNPVKSEFTGHIAIKGLPQRTDIRITDINGNLVYHTQVEAGQATWNGKDYTGRRPQTGVYLVLVADRTSGKVLKTGKIIFQH